MSDFNAEMKEVIPKWFKNHVATCKALDDETTMIVWAQPDTMVYSITYIIRHGTLMVYGDLYSAIYRWSSNISFPFLAGCNLDYFHEKCEASPEGREYRSWNEKEAIKDFKDYVRDHLRELTADEIRAWKTKWADDYEACLSGMQEGSQLFWHAVLLDHSDFRFEGLGDDDNYLFTIGMPITACCQAHLIGIRMAVAQLKEKGVFK